MMYTYAESSQINIFKYFCIFDYYLAHLSLFLAALSVAATLMAHIFARFPPIEI